MVVVRTAGDVSSPDVRWTGVVTSSTSTDAAVRIARPHTAHGTRSSEVSGEISVVQGASGAGGEAAPVVAGARGVMRWVHDHVNWLLNGM